MEHNSNESLNKIVGFESLFSVPKHQCFPGSLFCGFILLHVIFFFLWTSHFSKKMDLDSDPSSLNYAELERLLELTKKERQQKQLELNEKLFAVFPASRPTLDENSIISEYYERLKPTLESAKSLNLKVSELEKKLEGSVDELEANVRNEKSKLELEKKLSELTILKEKLVLGLEIIKKSAESYGT